MTSSNRFLNRALIFFVGLVLLLGGGAVAAGALDPDVQQTVSNGADDAISPTQDALTGGAIWILWIAAGAALLAIVLLVVFIVRHGGGRSSTLVEVGAGKRDATPTGGALIVDAKVAEQVLEDALAHDPNIVSIDVTAFEVRRETVLRITAHVRRGASPIDVRRVIDDAVTRWDALLGTETPVVIQIVGGLRAQMTSAARVS